MRDAWRRHDLWRVNPRAWPRVVGSHPRLAAVPRAAGWAERGWPVIVRARVPGDAPGMIPVGLPLPPGDGKLRLGAQVAPEDMRERVPPLTLRAAREDAPISWRPTVDAVLALEEGVGEPTRVFGSLLWQSLTGLSYLTAASDLDLLWPVDDADAAARIVRGLARIDAEAAVRVDGEILFPDGCGVQWREWLSQPSEVLVKTISGAELRDPRSLFPLPAA